MGIMDLFKKKSSGNVAKDRPVSYTHLDVYKRQTLSTRRLRFGYQQQFSRSAPGACFGVVGEELTAYLILEMAGAMR